MLKQRKGVEFDTLHSPVAGLTGFTKRSIDARDSSRIHRTLIQFRILCITSIYSRIPET